MKSEVESSVSSILVKSSLKMSDQSENRGRSLSLRCLKDVWNARGLHTISCASESK
jgi:hypothetical protein